MNLPDFLQSVENLFESELQKLTTLPFEIVSISGWNLKANVYLDTNYFIEVEKQRDFLNRWEWRVKLKDIHNNKVTFANIYSHFLHPQYDELIQLFSQVKLPFTDVSLDIAIDKRDCFRFYTLYKYEQSLNSGVSVVIYEQDVENDLKRMIYLLKPFDIRISTLNMNVSVYLRVKSYNFGENLLEWDKFFMILSSVMRYVNDPQTDITLISEVIDGKIRITEEGWLTLLKGGDK